MTDIPKDWICTDIDNQQYGRQISEKVFEFKEKNHNKDITGGNDFVQMTIDLNDYSENSMYDLVSSFYGYDDFKKMLNDKEYWIIAECIFEMESELY